MVKNQSIPFKSLSPIDDIPENSSFKALDAARSSKTVFNIAITGPFGSGKSSFLRSYLKKKNLKKNSIEISLASFLDEKRELKEIEFSILQKLMFKDTSKPPEGEQWDFSVDFKGALSTGKLYFLSFLIITISYFPLKEFMDNFTTAYSIYLANQFNWVLPDMCKNFFRIPPLLILSYSLNLVLLWFYRLLGKVTKITTPVGEIEIDNDTNLSLIDTNMDNIIHFFKEHKKYEYVILEDLDRLEDLRIFTKLRELNLLLNSCEFINQRVTFIYAVRDDLFTGEERTKFFDFMVPVIPLVNPSNSLDFIVKEYDGFNDELLNERNRDFLQDICLYITDTRTIYNVVNEYLIYSKELDNNLDFRKLFAIILYKNFFPKDFDDLHKNKGAFYNLFRIEKSDYRRVFEAKLDKRITEINQKIEKSNQELTNNIEDLRRIFLSEISEKIKRNIPIGTISACISNAGGHFDKILSEQSIQVIQNNNPRNIQPHKVPADLISPYKQREEAVINKKTQVREQLKEELISKRKEISQINTYSMQMLSQEYDMNIQEMLKKHDNFKKIDNDAVDLLAYLIREGYLAEDYHYYISHFFEGAITQNDRDFLLSIKNQRALTPSYQLDAPWTLIDKINTHEWNRPEILNNSLLDYTIESSSDRTYLILNQVIKWQNDSFLEQYQLPDKNKPYIYPWLMKHWEKFAKKIKDLYGIDAFFDLVLFLSTAKLDFSSESEKFNLQEIQHYFKLTEDLAFITYSRKKGMSSEIKRFFNTYGIHFSTVSSFEVPEDLQFILEHNLFTINRAMICLILSYYEGEPIKLERQDILTSLNENGDKAMFQLVEQNREKIALLMVERGELAEKENILTPFLNKLTEESSKEIILNLPAYYFQNPSEVKKELHPLVLEYSKIHPLIANLHLLLQNDTIPEEKIIDFLRSEDASQLLSISLDNISKEHPYLEDIKKFIILSLQERDLPFNPYKSIIQKYPYYIETDWNNITDEKIQFLIECNHIQFNQENFNVLVNRDEKSTSLKFLDKNFDSFKDIQIDLEVVKLYISDDQYQPERKKSLFHEYMNGLFNEGSHHFMIEFVLDYNYSEEVINFSTLWGSIEDEKTKLDFLILQANHLKKQFLNYVHSLGDDYKGLALHDRRQPKIPASEQNRKLLEILKKKNHISSYGQELSYDDSDIFRVHNGG